MDHLPEILDVFFCECRIDQSPFSRCYFDVSISFFSVRLCYLCSIYIAPTRDMIPSLATTSICSVLEISEKIIPHSVGVYHVCIEVNPPKKKLQFTSDDQEHLIDVSQKKNGLKF